MYGILVSMHIVGKKNLAVLGSYLDEAVYGANDGIITTFAVVSGAAGAGLSSETVIIMGIANLIADGFSMGASSFLAIRTKEDVERLHRVLPWRRNNHAYSRSLVTFGAFVCAGAIPLLPFFNSFAEGREFVVSAVGAGITFFLVGGARTFVTKRGFLASGLEMFTVGSLASVLAYTVGWAVELVVR